MDDLKVQVQTRRICPGWAKVPKAERNLERVNKHRAECTLGCGYYDGDQYIYKFVDLAEFAELLGMSVTVAGNVRGIAEAIELPKPRMSRRVKETPAPAPDPLDDDNLDDLL